MGSFNPHFSTARLKSSDQAEHFRVGFYGKTAVNTFDRKGSETDLKSHLPPGGRICPFQKNRFL